MPTTSGLHDRRLRRGARLLPCLATLVLAAACGGGSGPGTTHTGDGGVGSGGGSGGGGGGGSWLVSKDGRLASTSDGIHFASAPSPTQRSLFSLVCFGHRLGWAAGAGGTIIATRDGGDSWWAQSSSTQADLRAIFFHNASLGLAVGAGGTALRTVDGGATWRPISSGMSGDLHAVAISSDGATAWIAGDSGAIFRSTDAGQTFARVASGTTAALRALRFSDDGQRGFAVGDGGALLKSLDGGATWTSLPAAPGDLSSISVSEIGVVAVGAGGLVWRSDDGSTFAKVDTGTRAALASVGFSESAPGTGWAVGAHGTILVTFDRGLHFEPGVTDLTGDLTSVEDL